MYRRIVVYGSLWSAKPVASARDETDLPSKISTESSVPGIPRLCCGENVPWEKQPKSRNGRGSGKIESTLERKESTTDAIGCLRRGCGRMKTDGRND